MGALTDCPTVNETVYLIRNNRVIGPYTVSESGTDYEGDFFRCGADYDTKIRFAEEKVHSSMASAVAAVEGRNCFKCIHIDLCKAYTSRHPGTNWRESCGKICKFYRDTAKYVHFPFTIGDEVYVITRELKEYKYEIVKATVKSMKLTKDGKDISYSVRGYYDSGYEYIANFSRTSIGKKVFTHPATAVDMLNTKKDAAKYDFDKEGNLVYVEEK